MNTKAVARIILCRNCGKVYSRHTDTFRAVHPYLLTGAKERDIKIEKTICPVCQLKAKICAEQVEEAFGIRNREEWTVISGGN